ncbi:hypothetical protein ACFOD4_16725 [Pseudoroseomonas globiformis]|uniref:Uncharacterized protein n=1 Tax=Teichococcus globiformis TaxID=2307229 RepID=A0ABV7G5G1_9PROT
MCRSRPALGWQQSFGRCRSLGFRSKILPGIEQSTAAPDRLVAEAVVADALHLQRGSYSIDVMMLDHPFRCPDLLIQDAVAQTSVKPKDLVNGKSIQSIFLLQRESRAARQ